MQNLFSTQVDDYYVHQNTNKNNKTIKKSALNENVNVMARRLIFGIDEGCVYDAVLFSLCHTANKQTHPVIHRAMHIIFFWA